MRKDEKFVWIKISDKEYEELSKAENKVKTAKVLKRIQAFKLMYMGWKYSQIAKFLKVTNDTITDWIKIYKTEGLTGLLNLKYKGRQPLLNRNQLAELRTKHFKTAKEAKKYIEEKFGITYNVNHVQEMFKKNFSYPIKKPD